MRTSNLRRYLLALAVIGACTGVAALLHSSYDFGNVVAVYLLGVVVIAARHGRGPAILASALGAVAVDFLFVPPIYGFLPEQAAHLLTFLVMLVVAFTVSALAAALLEQLRAEQERQERTATLFALARDLARAGDEAAVAAAVDRHVHERFGRRARLLPAPEAPPGALPLTTANGPVGALAIEPPAEEQRGYLQAFADQAANALERTQLAAAAQHAAVAVEQERLRSTLLASVSHDLRTPLASIVGAATTLLRDQPLDDATRRGLLESIHEEADRLDRQVRNLLYLTRLDAGTVQPNRQWTPVEDVVGAALTRLEQPLLGRTVTTRIDADLPVVPMDDLLIEQVLLNLLENVLRHTPPGTPLEIAASADRDHVRIRVGDRGPGLSDPHGVFLRLGLGLSICRAIASLHGGRLEARNRDGGGAEFALELPLAAPPSLPPLAARGTP